MARRLPHASGHNASQHSNRNSNRASTSSRRGHSHQNHSSSHSSSQSSSHSSHSSRSSSHSSHSSSHSSPLPPQQGEARASSRHSHRGHHRTSRHPPSRVDASASSSSCSSSSSPSSSSSSATSSRSTNSGVRGHSPPHLSSSSSGDASRPASASVALLSDLPSSSGPSASAARSGIAEKQTKKDSKGIPFAPAYRQFSLASHVDKRRVCANWRVTHFPEIWALAKNKFLRAQDEDQYIDSPLFGDNEVGLWFLRLYPYGDSKNAGSLELYLMVDSCLAEDVLVHYKLQIFKQHPNTFPSTSQTQGSKRDFIVQYEDSDVYSKNEPGVGYGPTHLCDVSTRRKARALAWADGSLRIRALLDCPILEALAGPRSATASRPRPVVALRHLSCKREETAGDKKENVHALQRSTPPSLSEEVAAFIEQEKDMEIEFHGEVFEANKLILVSRSKVFNAMLKGLFREGPKGCASVASCIPRLSGQKRVVTENEENRLAGLTKINLSETAGLTVSALRNLLLYMHTDMCPLLSPETEEKDEKASSRQTETERINALLELLVAADLYDVPVLLTQHFLATSESRINCRRLVKATRLFANSLTGGAVAGKMLQLLESYWSSSLPGPAFASVSLSSSSPEEDAFSPPDARKSPDATPCSDTDIVTLQPAGSILLNRARDDSPLARSRQARTRELQKNRPARSDENAPPGAGERGCTSVSGRLPPTPSGALAPEASRENPCHESDDVTNEKGRRERLRGQSEEQGWGLETREEASDGGTARGELPPTRDLLPSSRLQREDRTECEARRSETPFPERPSQASASRTASSLETERSGCGRLSDLARKRTACTCFFDGEPHLFPRNTQHENPRRYPRSLPSSLFVPSSSFFSSSSLCSPPLRSVYSSSSCCSSRPAVPPSLSDPLSSSAATTQLCCARAGRFEIYPFFCREGERGEDRQTRPSRDDSRPLQKRVSVHREEVSPLSTALSPGSRQRKKQRVTLEGGSFGCSGSTHGVRLLEGDCSGRDRRSSREDHGASELTRCCTQRCSEGESSGLGGRGNPPSQADKAQPTPANPHREIQVSPKRRPYSVHEPPSFPFFSSFSSVSHSASSLSASPFPASFLPYGDGREASRGSRGGRLPSLESGGVRSGRSEGVGRRTSVGDSSAVPLSLSSSRTPSPLEDFSASSQAASLRGAGRGATSASAVPQDTSAVRPFESPQTVSPHAASPSSPKVAHSRLASQPSCARISRSARHSPSSAEPRSILTAESSPAPLASSSPAAASSEIALRPASANGVSTSFPSLLCGANVPVVTKSPRRSSLPRLRLGDMDNPLLAESVGEQTTHASCGEEGSTRLDAPHAVSSPSLLSASSSASSGDAVLPASSSTACAARPRGDDAGTFPGAMAHFSRDYATGLQLGMRNRSFPGDESDRAKQGGVATRNDLVCAEKGAESRGTRPSRKSLEENHSGECRQQGTDSSEVRGGPGGANGLTNPSPRDVCAGQATSTPSEHRDSGENLGSAERRATPRESASLQGSCRNAASDSPSSGTCVSEKADTPGENRSSEGLSSSHTMMETTPERQRTERAGPRSQRRRRSSGSRTPVSNALPSQDMRDAAACASSLLSPVASSSSSLSVPGGLSPPLSALGGLPERRCFQDAGGASGERESFPKVSNLPGPSATPEERDGSFDDASLFVFEDAEEEN
ncbi:conserved hypothetical protein [Neospora caninum Liverpool]|uniref:BTB domain-containing protein n=1 Tax=Neospora caninum (strain Liverpool) TaxID=572307 RepID=F0VJD9_NEOCL|nr:conserved hypothetical protein [Neospora caninum Liverpool]CBZ53850.1 conserved hypothetical protein [Neospora caninum Liverpool]|eukprot:XP_003883882.1 conserved hypothetical protein [Neospora caninum Liverpool]